MSRHIIKNLIRISLLALTLTLLFSFQLPFVMGAAPAAVPVGFNSSNLNLNGNAVTNPTTLDFGPDGRLYVGLKTGVIRVYTISRTGPNAYTTTAVQTINNIRDLPNRNDNGAVNTTVERQLTGLTVRGTATNPVIYATSSDWRKGTASDTNLDTNSGVITRLTWNGSAWTTFNIVRGLPRSEEYHAINGIQLDAANNRLFVAIGGNTNMGAPGSSLAYLPEYAYSAAILSVDLTAIGNTTYDMPTLDDPTRANVNGITDPSAPGYNGIDVSDPWGGNDGLNQAKLTPNSPVQIYAPGFRNPYDLVLTQSGRLYAVDNGPNSGFGGFLTGEGTTGTCNNTPNENNSASRYDNLHLVTQGMYGGHPAPIRANANAGWTTAAGAYLAPGSSSLPVDWPPVPASMLDIRQCDFRGSATSAANFGASAEDGSIAGWGFSTNGITEYTASNFEGQMKGNLLLASYNNTIQRVALNAAGTAATSVSSLASGFGTQPLDVVAQGDFGLFPGTVWIANYISNTITVLEPNDYAGVPSGTCDASDSPTLDPDLDGYKNSDEIDNGTSPCSGASRPSDADNDKVSDLNDNDDDNDSILDINDAFQVDANNGLTTNLPMYLSFDPSASDFGVGLLDSGFTGMMVNGSTDYLTMYDYTQMTVGGITKTFTVDDVPAGDAFAASNNQQYAFQKGVNVDSSTPDFTVRTRVNGPFFNGQTPEGNQSLGLFIGTGHQDNYVKLVVNANNGAGGIQLVRENNGTVTSTQFNNSVLASSYINLMLTISPFTGQVQARYSNESGVVTNLGAPFTLSGGVKSAVQQSSKALAVGIISTSRGGPTFTAQWDDFEVNYNQPGVLSIKPGTYDFAPVTVGQNAYTSVTLKNEGVGTDPSIQVTGITLNGSAAFTISSGPAFFPITLAPGQEEVIGIRFAPTIDGSVSTLLTANHNGVGSQTTAGLSGSGQSQPAAIFRVNAGGPQIAATDGGIAWGRDQTGTGRSIYYTAGSDNVATGAINANTLGVPNALFTDERWDASAAPPMTWAFPVTAGQYEVSLYFAETYTGVDAPGERLFHVDIEGARVLTNFDQWATALSESGNGRNAIVRKFPVTINGTGQSIDIVFTHVTENTTVKAIEIRPKSVTGALVASPGSLNFNNVTVGAQSATQTIRLSNSAAVGGPTVAVSALNVTGTGMQIVAPPVTPFNLTPGQFVDIGVRFAPASAGLINGMLTATHNGTNTPLQITLTGRGTQPPALPATLSSDSDPLVFNTVQPGLFDTEQLQLTNLIVSGNPSITVSSVTISGPDAAGFSHNFSGPVTLTSGQALTLNMTHNPMTQGTKTATMTIVHSGSNSPLVIGLTGDSTPGVLPSINVNFQLANYVPPTGYVRDFGEPFGLRTLANQGNGLYYGWVIPGTHTPRDLSVGGSTPGNGRRRFLNSDPRLDTIFHMQYTGSNGTPLPGAWEIAVPNGTYLVEVAVGDPQLNSGFNVLNIEGVNVVPGFTQTATELWHVVTKSVTVTDGRMTLDANGGVNTRIMYLSFQPMNEGQPYVTGVNPPNNAMNVNTSTGVAFYVSLPTSGMGVDPSSLNSNTVRFFETNTGTPVAANYGTSGGLDDITAQPVSDLLPNTSYTVQVTSGARDMTGAPFVPYTMTFTTGTASGGSPLVGVTFEQVPSGAPDGNLYTSVTMGPDGRLYAGSLGGTIYSWAINTDGTLTGMRTINNYVGRAIIGMAFSPSSTSNNMELWVTNNFAALNAAPNFSGRIGALTSTNGVSWTNIDYIDGMPRAVRDHMTNSLAFGPDGRLYLTNGSVSAMGDRDNAWGNEPETILSGATLRIDVGLLKAYYSAYGVLDVSTGTPEPSGDLLDANNTQLGDPRLSATNTDLADPNKYYNPQAPNAPLTLYATGMRNAFDLVWHSSGNLFVPTNGSAGGGNTPATPTTLPISCQYRTDKAINGNYTGPMVPASQPPTQSDYLFRVVQNGFYGHPNPTRCEWVLYGGNPTAGPDSAQVGNHYPVGTMPDRNFRGYAYDMGMNASSNGVIEYKNDAFGGIMQGRLLITRYSLYNDIVVLQVDSAGNVINASVGTTGLKGFVDPLDLTEDVATGNLYVTDLADAGGKIVLVRPLGANIPRIELDPEELFFADQIGGSPSASQQITVSNTGTGILNLTNIDVAGPFQIVGTPPVSVPPFSSVTISVAYQATAAGVQTGTVTITSNATNTPTASVLLSGGGFSTANTEPSLQLIVNTYHIPVNIGDDDSGTAVIHSDGTQQRAPLLGQEVSVQSFQRFEDGNVDIEILSVFGPKNSGDVPVATVGWYLSGQPNTRSQLFQISNNTPQTLDPTFTGTLSFDPGTNAFGFWSNWPFFGSRIVYSEDPLNTFSNAIPHHIRVYQLLDSSGVVVPNAFVVATEEHTSGFDYNDLVMIVRNVKPAQTDITPPTVNVVLSGSQQSPGVYINQVSVSVVATDTESGIATVEYSLDGGPFQLYTGPFVVTAATAHTVIARASDLADLQTTTPPSNFSIVTIPSSGIVRYENRDWQVLNSLNIPNTEYFNTWLTFSNLHSSVVQRQSHNIVTLRIHNDGTTPLQILGLELDTPTRWTLMDNPTVPMTVAPGSFYDLRVRFIENGAVMAVFAGTLRVTTTDPTNPVQIVQLRGAYQTDTGGSLENDFYDLFRMFGTTTNVPTSLTSQYIPMGDEVLSFTWKKVPGIASIYARQAVAYQGFTASSFAFQNGGTVLASMIPSNQNTQSVLPVKTNGGTDYVEMMFTPAANITSFNMNAAGYRTDRCSGVTNCIRQGLRVWPVYNPEGELVPNLYFLGQDFVGNGCGIGSANCDYQDNMYFVYGIMPSTVTPAFTINKTAPNTQSVTNTDFTYTINIKNTTIFPHTATVTDTLPAGMSYVTHTNTIGNCTFATGTLTCNMGQMNGHDEATITITVRGTTDGYKDNTATLTSGSYTVSDTERTLFYNPGNLPGSITFNKNAVPDSITSFDFTGTLGNFRLTDDGIHHNVPVIFNVNFGVSATAPAGFDVGDIGLPYTAAKGYGWVTEATRNLNNPTGIDISATGREKTEDAAMIQPYELRTLLNMQYPTGTPGPAAWRYDLPNGTYEVTVSVGDPSSGNTGSSYTIRLNGTNLITNYVPSGGVGESMRYKQATALVTVTNQRLIVDAVGGQNTKINYIKIQGTTTVSRTRIFPSLIAGTYTVNEIVPVGWRQDSFLCTGNTTTTSGTGATIVLNPGQAITCNIVNSRITGPAVDLEVTPDTQTVPRNGSGTFTVTITNIGSESLTNIQTTSPVSTCVQTSAGPLQPGDAIVFNCSVNPVTESITNTMSVVGTGTTGNATDSDTAVLTMVNPALTINKTPDSQSIYSGNTVMFTITVQNTGDVELTTVAVTDPLAASCARTIGTMTPGQTVTYTCMVASVASTLTNVATVTGKYGAATYTATDSAVVAVNTVTYGTPTFRVNAGGPQVTGSGGVNWTVDTRTSRSPYLVSNPSGTQNNVATQNNAFTNTTGAPNAIFIDERSDPAGTPEMQWEFPVSAGSYEVRLYFIEHSRTTVGGRVFDVKIEDVTVLDDFDIWKESGSARVAQVRKFPVTIVGTGQKIDIDFINGVENPSIRAIEIVPVTVTSAATLSATPTNINFGNGQITRTSTPVTVDLTHLGTTGAAAINVTNVTIIGTDASSFSVTPSGTTSINFTAGQVRDDVLSVTFNPTTLGSKSATLQITHSGANNPVLVYLTGMAVPLILPDMVSTPNPVVINQVENTAPLITNIPLTTTEGAANFTINNASFPTWLQVSPLTGTIPANGSVSLTFTTSVTGLALGSYSYSIPISAPGYDPLLLPVTFNVNPYVHPIQIIRETGALVTWVGGTIDASGFANVRHNSNATFNFSAQVGYAIDDILIDGVSIGIVPSHTFTAVVDDGHTVEVQTRVVPIRTITATAQAGGSVSPSGATQVSEGSEPQFNFLPDPGYMVDQLLIDGNPVTITGAYYKFPPVTADHTLDVSFTLLIPSGITVVADNVPNGPGNFNFTITDGGPFSDVFTLVDNGGSTNTKAFNNIQPGTYTLVGTIPAGKVFNALTCTGAAVTTDMSTGTAVITVTPGSNVNCLYRATEPANCSPYSASECGTVTVPITSEFCLRFDAPAGGISGTGFTMVDKPSVNKYPATPSVPLVPGYEPSLVSLSGGRLVINATRGMGYQTPAQNSANNTQVNALGVGIDPTGPFIISLDVINAPFPDTANNEQSGIWFGLNDDNFIKLVLANRTGAGNGLIELRREIGGVSTGLGVDDVRQANVTGVNTATINLEMRLNPTTNEISAKYTSSTGETGILGPLVVPASFFAGQMLPDTTTGPVSFAGLYASKRFNTNAAEILNFTFDNFCIEPNTNQAPTAVADSITVGKGNTATILDSGATSVLANDTDTEGDPLSAILVTGPSNGALTLNANGTFSYTHNNGNATTDSFTYKVSDGQGQSNTVTVNIAVVLTCAPYSTGACTTIPVTITSNVCLTFNGSGGGLSNTGFTMVDKPSVNKYPATPSQPSYPGYEPSLISVTGGQLVINATRGMGYQTPTENSANNTQVNALGIGVRPTGPFIISLDVINSPFPDTANNEQSGIWFGLNDDNFIKLVLANRTGAGNGLIELRREIGGVSTGLGVNDVRQINVTNVNTATINLEMRLNPTTNEISGKFTSSTGETGVLGPLTVPASFFSGIILPDTTTGPVSFAGLYASKRFNTNAAEILNFTFDNFCVKPNNNQVPTAVADSITVAKGSTTTVLDSNATSVLANDTDPEGDPLTAVLVTGPTNGTLTLNANGTFSYTHNNNTATTDSFTYRASDGQGQSNTVTVNISIVVVCGPYTLSPCTTIPVNYSSNFCLTFNGSGGGLANTGFTMVDTHSTNRYPATPSVPTLPGYEPSLINVTGGQLVLTSTRGSFTQTQTENTGNNTQVNALGVGVLANAPIIIRTQVINPNFPDTSNGEQVGLWFGLNEDNYVRLSVNNKAGLDNGDVELRREINSVTSGAAANARVAAVNNITTATITLELRLDPSSSQVSGKYTSTTGETGTLGPLVLPAEFFAGQMMPDTTTGPVSFAGIFGTSRFNAGTPLVYTFDNFCVQPNTNQAPVATAETMTVAKGTSQTVLDSGATSVLANDTDPDGDALTAVLVTGPTNGTLTLNANGTFSYTHNNGTATTDSFTYRASDGQTLSNTVTVNITIYTACLPYALGACSTIPVTVNPATCLVFDGTQGGLANTGFRMAATRTNMSSPTTTSVAGLPGYEPNNLALTGGRLVITSSRGTFNTTSNNQINGLAVGVANPGMPFVVMTDVINSPFPDATLNEQSGLWFGLDQDNMIRLAVNNRAGVGFGTVELRREINGVSTSSATDVVSAQTLTDVNTSTITIKMVLNPTTNQVTAEYSSTNGQTGSLGPLSVPASFFAGQMVPDSNGTVGPVSFAGVFASSRNNTTTPALPFTFDNFCVRPVSAPPTAVADAITVNEGGTKTTLNSGATSVLTNDTDPENDPLTAAVVTNVTNGTLTLNANGTFSYTHNGSETTTDSFTYRANDGFSNSAPVTVTITITPVNDAPVAVDDAYTVAEDTTLTVTAANRLTLNDTDAENSTLTAAKVSNPSHGTVTVNADGTFTYTPTANYSGTDTFTYRVNDGTTNSVPATVTITINPANDAPVAVANTLTVAEGGTATTLTGGATSVLANDTDIDGDVLTAAVVTTTSNGTLTLNSDGTFSYTHNGSETTSDSFTYKANDGTVDSNTVTVTITITPVNDVPVAVDDAYTVSEGGTLSVTAANKVTLNDTDAEGATLTAVLVTSPANGSLTLNANGTFTYTHNGSETTSDSFTYQADDGPNLSNIATVTITITAANDAPLAVADAITVAEGGTATTLTGGATSVLANDTDAENNTLTAAVVTNPSRGTLTLNSDGTFSYTHDGSETTSDSFTYKANDGTVDSNTVTVTITITPVNDAPIAVSDAYLVNEGATLSVTAANKVTGNDSDAEGSVLTAVLVTNVTNGTLTLNANGTFTYTHDGSETTSDSFTYQANDGVNNSNTATVTITINGVNDAPVAVADAITVAEGGTATTLVGGANNVTANDTDAEGNTLTAAVVSNPSRGTLTLNANGTFSYTHDGSETTSDSFTYRVNDGTVNSNTVTVTITITPVNDAPVANDDAYSVDEDTTLTVTAANKITLNDNDAENNALTVVLVGNVTHGTLTLNADGTFTYTPTLDYSGPDSFTYRANDGTVSGNIATVTITIGNVDDAPVAVADAITVAEGGTATTLVGGATKVTANDTDAESSPLTAIKVTNPTRGTLTLNSDGTFSYTHDGSETTTDSFTYQANDGANNSNIVTVTITITPVNDAPVAIDDAYSVDEDTTLTVLVANGVLLNDTDAENNPLTAVLVTGPSHGALTLNADGSLIYTPTANYSGPDSFTYRANDGTVSGNIATVTITINDLNEVPVAVADALTVAEGGTATTLNSGATKVTDNDMDAESSPLTAILVTGPSNGTLTLNANGTFSYQHNGSETLGDSFTYKANDGIADSNTVTVTITITPVNDAPVAFADSYTTNEDTALPALGIRNVLTNDTDADSGTLTAVLVTGPAHGTLTLNADGTFTFVPTANYHGMDSFTYSANDGTVSGTPATVTITINSVGDAPTGVADSYNVVRGGTLVQTAPGVLANDSDVDGPGDTLSVVSIFTMPTYGSLTFGSDGSFTYVNNGNAATSDSFQYVLADSDPQTSNVVVTVNLTVGPNTPPTASADAFSVVNGGTATVLANGETSVLANDQDTEGNSMTAVLVTQPARGTLTLNPNGTFSYTHNGSPTAPDSFTYQVSDGMGLSNIVTVSITVTGSAVAPVATNDTASVGAGAAVLIPVTGNDTFKPAQTPVVTIVTPPSQGTAIVSGTNIQFTAPATLTIPTVSFTYNIKDISTLTSNTATVTIVYRVNGPSLYLDATQITQNPTVGSNVQFSILVRNNGTVNLTDIYWQSIGGSTCTYPNFDLAVGAERIFTCQDNNVQMTYNRTFLVENTAHTAGSSEIVRVIVSTAPGAGSKTTTTSTALSAGTYDSSDSRIRYAGSWTSTVENTVTYRRSTTMNDRVAFTVSTTTAGSQLVLYRQIGKNMGTMEVCYNLTCQFYSNEFSTTVASAALTLPLPVGETTVEIRVGTASDVKLDAVEVRAGQPVVTTPSTPVATPTDAAPQQPQETPVVTETPIESTATETPVPTVTETPITEPAVGETHIPSNSGPSETAGS